MKARKLARLLLGLLTVGPLAGLFSFSRSELVFGAAVMIEFGLLALAFVYLFTTARLSQGDRWTWAMLLTLGNALSLPLFFFVIVWPAED